MAILPTSNLDYTDFDYDSIKLRLQNLIKSVFPEWTDYNISNFGNILLELFAFVGDVLGFYQDNQARQSRITTATQRQALLGLVRLIGYTPATATAAQATVTLTLASVPAGDVTFDAGEKILTEEITEPIKYQFLATTTILGGTDPPTIDVVVENSETWEEMYSNTGVANQSFTLEKTGYIDETLSASAGDGTYTEVDSFLDSTSVDKHFTTKVDQNDRVTATFGNGVNGSIPIGDITFTYKTGGGSAGRVEANKLVRLERTSRFDSLGSAVTVTVTNALPSSGGTDRETVQQIKYNAPEASRVINRSVAKEDFEINVRRLPWVARSLMLTSDEDPGVAENTGLLYVIPEGGGTLTAAQIDEVEDQITIEYPHTLTFQPQVMDVPYLEINIFAVIYIKDGYIKSAVKAAVEANLTAFFQVTNDEGTPNLNVDFGANIKDSEGNVVSELALSDIYNVIRDTDGVRKIGAGYTDFTLNDAHDDVSLTTREFPKLGTTVLYDGDTGQQL